ncbi:MAG: hypothetical protein JST73_11990 [Actinobacteria bacterium]|nr:hypothetical protein [Actinomycetota bacterium]
MNARPIVAPSARKHEVSDADMLHAFDHPIRVFELDEGLTLIVGPSSSAQLLEIGVVAGDLALVIVHAMPARDKFLR